MAEGIRLRGLWYHPSRWRCSTPRSAASMVAAYPSHSGPADMRRERRLRRERRTAAVPRHLRALLDLVNGSEADHAEERQRWCKLLDGLIAWQLDAAGSEGIAALEAFAATSKAHPRNPWVQAVVSIFGTRIADLRRCEHPSCRRFFFARRTGQRFHSRQCQWDAGNKRNSERRKATMKKNRETEKRRASLAREAVRSRS